ncbi:MAG: DeoR/GlpR transcriptional regulator [Clostridia bacterium]|nr:DeoR/GlpR transcriptional regulator [Clostridia bacterium]
MIQYQRHKEILDLLELHRTLSIRRLAKELFTSESTVRRDLTSLEQMGLIRRVYGGAVLAKYTNTDMPAFHREQENSEKKAMIASRAASLIRDGMALFIDASTTASHLADYLGNYKDLTVVTNSLPLTEKLGELGRDHVRVFCTGGQFLPRNRAFAGASAIRTVEQFRADLFFFSSCGISLEGEISDFSEEETELRRAMLHRAKTRVFLADDSKFGHSFLFRVCGREDCNYIVSNQPLPPSLLSAQLPQT